MFLAFLAAASLPIAPATEPTANAAWMACLTDYAQVQEAGSATVFSIAITGLKICDGEAAAVRRAIQADLLRRGTPAELAAAMAAQRVREQAPENAKAVIAFVQSVRSH